MTAPANESEMVLKDGTRLVAVATHGNGCQGCFFGRWCCDCQDRAASCFAYERSDKRSVRWERADDPAGKSHSQASTIAAASELIDWIDQHEPGAMDAASDHAMELYAALKAAVEAGR